MKIIYHQSGTKFASVTEQELVGPTMVLGSSFYITPEGEAIRFGSIPFPQGFGELYALKSPPAALIKGVGVPDKLTPAELAIILEEEKKRLTVAPPAIEANGQFINIAAGIEQLTANPDATLEKIKAALNGKPGSREAEIHATQSFMRHFQTSPIWTESELLLMQHQRVFLCIGHELFEREDGQDTDVIYLKNSRIVFLNPKFFTQKKIPEPTIVKLCYSGIQAALDGLEKNTRHLYPSVRSELISHQKIDVSKVKLWSVDESSLVHRFLLSQFGTNYPVNPILKDLPCTRAYYTAIHRAVTTKAAEIRSGTTPPNDPSLLQISEAALTRPQVKFFSHVNYILGATGIKKLMFEEMLRTNIVLTAVAHVNACADALLTMAQTDARLKGIPERSANTPLITPNYLWPVVNIAVPPKAKKVLDQSGSQQYSTSERLEFITLAFQQPEKFLHKVRKSMLDAVLRNISPLTGCTNIRHVGDPLLDAFIKAQQAKLQRNKVAGPDENTSGLELFSTGALPLHTGMSESHTFAISGYVPVLIPNIELWYSALTKTIDDVIAIYSERVQPAVLNAEDVKKANGHLKALGAILKPDENGLLANAPLLMWPEDLEKVQRRTDRKLEASQRRVQENALNLQAQKAARLKPTPFSFDTKGPTPAASIWYSADLTIEYETSQRMQLLRSKLERLAKPLNLKITTHNDFAQSVLSNNVTALLQNIFNSSTFHVRRQLEAPEAAQQSLLALLQQSTNHKEIKKNHYGANHKLLKQAIMQMPELIIAIFGTSAQITQANKLIGGLLAEPGSAEFAARTYDLNKLAHGLLAAKGYTYLPDLGERPFYEEPKALIPEPLPAKKPTPPSTVTIITTTPRPAAPLVVRTPPRVKTKNIPLVSGVTITTGSSPKPPEKSPAQLRREAMLEAITALTKEALTQAQAIYDAQPEPKQPIMLKCDVINNLEQGYPIKLLFLTASGKKTDESSKDRLKSVLLTPHLKYYAECGQSPCHDDSFSIITYIRNELLNQSYIIPHRRLSSSKTPKVGLDDVIFPGELSVTKGTARRVILDESENRAVLKIEMLQTMGAEPDEQVVTEVGATPGKRQEKLLSTISIPLGIIHPSRCTPDIKAAVEAEIEARKELILAKIELDEAAQVNFTKREIMLELRNHANLNQQPWIDPEGIEVPGFEKQKLLFSNPQFNQSVYISPVKIHMLREAEGAYWRMEFCIHVKDLAGNHIVSRNKTVSLFTSDENLAMARALQTLGPGTGVPSLLDLIDEYKHYEWQEMEMRKGWHRIAIKPPTSEIERATEIDDLFSQMKRYEDDIGVDAILQPTPEGGYRINLTILRAVSPDFRKTANASPEPITYIENGKRKTIAFEVTLTNEQLIRRGNKLVNEGISPYTAKQDAAKEFVNEFKIALVHAVGIYYSGVAINAKSSAEEKERNKDMAAEEGKQNKDVAVDVRAFNPRTVRGFAEETIASQLKKLFGEEQAATMAATPALR